MRFLGDLRDQRLRPRDARGLHGFRSQPPRVLRRCHPRDRATRRWHRSAQHGSERDHAVLSRLRWNAERDTSRRAAPRHRARSTSTAGRFAPVSFRARPDPSSCPAVEGIDSYEITNTEVIFTFEKDYDPRVDGCLLAPTIATHNVVTLDSEGNDITGSDGMRSCFGQLAPSTGDFDPSGPAPSTRPAL